MGKHMKKPLQIVSISKLAHFIREPAEYATIEEIYNPAIHRTTHAIKQRAVHPERPIPEIPPVLLRFAAPPTELVETVQAKIDSLVQAADVKKGDYIQATQRLEV